MSEPTRPSWAYRARSWAGQDPERVRRTGLALVAITLAVLHIIFPGLGIDLTTVALIGIAAALVLLPSMRTILLYVKTVKLAGTEVTFRDDIAEVGRVVSLAVEETEAAVAEGDTNVVSPHGPGEAGAGGGPDTPAVDADLIERWRRVEALMESVEEHIKADSDPRGALVLVSAALEQAVAASLESIGERPKRSTLLGIRLGIERGIFVQSIEPAVREFLAVRNKVVHEGGTDIPDDEVRSLLYMGVDLVHALTAAAEPEEPDYDFVPDSDDDAEMREPDPDDH